MDDYKITPGAGVKKYLREIGGRGGRKKSERKTAAGRINCAKALAARQQKNIKNNP